MSKFMDFLDNMDSIIESETDIITEDYDDDDTLVEMPKYKKKVSVKPKRTKQKQSKDASVKIVEKRLRDKLYNVGLNEQLIENVTKYVLGDISKISDLSDNKSDTIKEETQQPIPNSIVGVAEMLLDGLPETPVSMPHSTMSEGTTQSSVSSGDFTDVADRATSLL